MGFYITRVYTVSEKGPLLILHIALRRVQTREYKGESQVIRYHTLRPTRLQSSVPLVNGNYIYCV